MVEFVDAIVSGRLAPGDALPREVALAERFGISRGVARECLRALEERGLVSVRHGSSTTVNPRVEWDLFDSYVLTAALGGPAAVELLGEYLECRRIVEIEAAGLAAERATPEALAVVEERLAAMVQALAERDRRRQEDAFHAADVAFHAALVEATGNAPLASLVRRIDAALLAARYPLARPAYRKTRAIPEHEAILAAVQAGDAPAARDAMRTHLDTVEQYLREHARRVARAA
jgi:DNA-binding FadR family transcriptional regulator